MVTDVAEGKLKVLEAIDEFWLLDKSMAIFVAFGKLKAPEGIEEIWL